MKRDKKRGAHLRNIGLKVLRFSDKEVFENLGGVLEKIFGAL
jgi:very-short-patch-repair endonuclease